MKKIIYLTCLITISFLLNSYAQTLHVNWTNSYANTTSLNYSNESRKMVRDAGGNTYVLADATSDVDPTGVLGTSTYHYTVLLKYDNTGNLITTRLINVMNHMSSGFDNKGAFGIEIGSDGFLYIGYNTYNAVTDFNVSIAKYSIPALIRKWAYNFNPVSGDQGVDLKVGSGGLAYAIVKSMTGTDSQYHILNADTSGISTIPFYSFDQNMDYLNCLLVSSTNEIFVTGYRFVNSVKNSLTAGIKTNGLLKFKKTYNGGTIIRDDSGKQLMLDANGYLYVIGTSDRGVPNLNDVMVLCYFTGNGKFIWVTFIDDNSANDFGITVRPADPDNIYVGSVAGGNVNIARLQTATGTITAQGYYSPVPISPYISVESVSISKMEISVAQNIYCTGTILATDTNNMIFSSSYLVKLFPVTYRTNIEDVIKPEFDNIEGELAISYSSSDMILDENSSIIYYLRDKILPYDTHGREVIEIFAYDIPTPNRTSSSEPSFENKVSIYPNPAVDQLEINSVQSLQRIEIVDNLGRKVKNHEITDDFKAIIGLADLPNGMYFLLIHSLSGDMQTFKFIKK